VTESYLYSSPLWNAQPTVQAHVDMTQAVVLYRARTQAATIR
jgi:hypothetical protein